MRRARWLLLVLIAVIAGSLTFVYKSQKTAQARNAPKPPAKLPEAVSARLNDWTWEKTVDGRPVVRVWARDFKQNADGNRIELDNVTLHLFRKDGNSFDKVQSAKAEFDVPNGLLFSDGEVEITMAVPSEPDPKPSGRLVVIKTSGVHFESKTGKAFTERPASFRFDRGEGQAVGAQYDPGTRELNLSKDVKLTWRGNSPKNKPMDIEAGSLVYKEAESKVFLTPWSKFRRDTLAMEGAAAVISISREGQIEAVEAATAKGVDTRPARTVQYSADQLNIYFDDSGVLKNVSGAGSAKLDSSSPTAKTHVTSDKIDLEFDPEAEESTLRKAVASSRAVVKSEPVPQANVPPADTRILTSDVIDLYMREGGKEMERAEAKAPGTIEFLPNRPGQKHRIVKGNGMTAEYGPANQLKTFTATEASTRTDNEPVRGKPQPPALTWSKGMAAHFDPKTGNMTLLEQWDHFRYEEGDRRANADRAELHQSTDDMKLLGAARVSDATGSTSADTISMKQKSGDFEAVGNVTSTRLPDKKKDQKEGGMLSGDDPVQARAARMNSANNNSLITYTGQALLWQGSNRITADTIKIDRKNNHLDASGNVVTQLLDNSETKNTKPDSPAKPDTPAKAGTAVKAEAKKKAPVFTNVKAPELTYDDKARLAHYKGGAQLVRAGMTVTAREIRAWLKEGEDSSLDHAFADGNVKIVQVSPERTRTGTSEHSEYYAAESKILLNGGQPVFVDSVKGTTKGRQITYFSNDDRFFVEGEEKKPVESQMLRRKKG